MDIILMEAMSNSPEGIFLLNNTVFLTQLVKIKYLNTEDNIPMRAALGTKKILYSFHPLPNHSLALLLEVFWQHVPC